MKRVTFIATALLLTVLAVFTARVAAQDTNTQERTFLTFSNSVELPNLTLPAGTYTFRLADTPSRNVVQVLSQDEKEMLGQWTFVPADRVQVSDDTVIMFREAREGTTPAVQFWYYPGERTGKEFIYPKDQAMRIAERTGVSVLSDDGRVSSNTAVTSTDAQGTSTAWPREGSADTSAANQAGAIQGGAVAETPATGNSSVGVMADATQAPAPAPQAVGTSGTENSTEPAPVATTGAELPQTASPLPLAGLLGLMSLAGAAGVRRFAAVRR